MGALAQARKQRAFTVAVTSNPRSPVARRAQIAICPATGPEVIAGSTRLKAGTAQKLALNMLSTAALVRLGHVYRNLMVNVQMSNAKLRRRALRILLDASGTDAESARAALEATGYDVKTSLVMLLTGADVDEARRRLEAAGGLVRRASN